MRSSHVQQIVVIWWPVIFWLKKKWNRHQNLAPLLFIIICISLQSVIQAARYHASSSQVPKKYMYISCSVLWTVWWSDKGCQFVPMFIIAPVMAALIIPHNHYQGYFIKTSKRPHHVLIAHWLLVLASLNKNNQGINMQTLCIFKSNSNDNQYFDSLWEWAINENHTSSMPTF